MDLKDQLVKAGLVSQKQARQASHRSRVDRTQDGGAASLQEAEARAQEARRQQVADKERDREIAKANADKAAERQNELRQQEHRASLIDTALREGRIENWGGARTYYFVDKTLIESLSVSDTAARLLQEGRAAIVRSSDPRAPYLLMKSSFALKLREVDPERIVTLHGEESPPSASRS